ncbi:hypothetical protein R50072_30440 [Simiduia litorea]|uniref:EF-hand domain-containing protein n=1 Tax=Simiduia litorea TaxID=1435348 RepID=UPI0036F3C284
MKRLLFTFVLLGTAVFADAQAPTDGSHSWLLAKYDLNGDSQISQEEISAKKLDIFRLMDLNVSGGVSYDEYAQIDSARRTLILKARFNKLDGDKDGEVTEAEYSSFLGQFSSIDANGDGMLDSTEMAPLDDEYKTHCFYWFCLRLEND